MKGHDLVFLYFLGLMLLAVLVIPLFATLKVIYMYTSDKYLFKVLDTNSVGTRIKNTLLKELPKIIASVVIAIIGIAGVLILAKVFDMEYYELFRVVVVSKSDVIKITLMSLAYGIISFLYTGFYKELIRIILGDKKLTIGCISYKYKNIEDYSWEDNILIMKIKTGKDTSNMSSNVSNISVFEIEIPYDRKDMLEMYLNKILSTGY